MFIETRRTGSVWVGMGLLAWAAGAQQLDVTLTLGYTVYVTGEPVLVQLEALACGVPVAAFPVTGPRDVIGDTAVGVLSDDLRAACLGALNIPRDACRAFALERSWDVSANQFLGHARNIATSFAEAV